MNKETIDRLRALHADMLAKADGDTDEWIEADEAFRLAFKEHALALLAAAESAQEAEAMLVENIDECPAGLVPAVEHALGVLEHTTRAWAMAEDRSKGGA